jgi:hypothetical protein
VRAPLVVVPLGAVGRFGVGGQALADERVVAGGEGPLVEGGRLSKAAPAGFVAGCVDLHEQDGDARRPHRLVATAASFQYMARRSWMTTPR